MLLKQVHALQAERAARELAKSHPVAHDLEKTGPEKANAESCGKRVDMDSNGETRDDARNSPKEHFGLKFNKQI